MEVLTILLSGLLGVLVKSSNAFECPQQNGLFPESSQCDSYWLCIDGKSELIRCENNQRLHIELLQCVDESQIPCDKPAELVSHRHRRIKRQHHSSKSSSGVDHDEESEEVEKLSKEDKDESEKVEHKEDKDHETSEHDDHKSKEKHDAIKEIKKEYYHKEILPLPIPAPATAAAAPVIPGVLGGVFPGARAGFGNPGVVGIGGRGGGAGFGFGFGGGFPGAGVNPRVGGGWNGNGGWQGNDGWQRNDGNAWQGNDGNAWQGNDGNAWQGNDGWQRAGGNRAGGDGIGGGGIGGGWGGGIGGWQGNNGWQGGAVEEPINEGRPREGGNQVKPGRQFGRENPKERNWGEVPQYAGNYQGPIARPDSQHQLSQQTPQRLEPYLFMEPTYQGNSAGLHSRDIILPYQQPFSVEQRPSEGLNSNEQQRRTYYFK